MRLYSQNQTAQQLETIFRHLNKMTKMASVKKAPSFKKALHFSEAEFKERQQRALKLMEQENLDGFLFTKQESLYYLTGYDTFGYVFFQAMYFHNDGSMRLITRIPDLRQALYTSTLDQKDILIRSDDAGSNPVSLVPKVLGDFGINSSSKRIGYEPDSCSLTHRLGKALEEAVAGLCTLVDHSDLFTRELRIVKSEAEMRKVRKAAYLADSPSSAPSSWQNLGPMKAICGGRL